MTITNERQKTTINETIFLWKIILVFFYFHSNQVKMLHNSRFLMKILAIILLNHFLIGTINAQKPPKGDAEIKIEYSSFTYKRDNNYKHTKKTTPKKFHSKYKMYFDKLGQIEYFEYRGAQCDNHYDILGTIYTYEYDIKGRLLFMDAWQCNCKRKINQISNTSYIYDSLTNNLIEEKNYEVETDTPFSKTNYWYIGLNFQGVFYDSTNYYKRDYDTIGRIASLTQIFNNKVRWKTIYSYTTNQRTGIMETYYQESKNYKTIQIIKYKDGKIGEIEDRHFDKNKYRKKVKIIYDEWGLISKIEYHEAIIDSEPYEITSYQIMTSKGQKNKSTEVIERVNKEILKHATTFNDI